MVRGIQKQVIHVKNPGNASWCEEAFLVVRPGAFAPGGGVTMAEEVERMLDGTREMRPIQPTPRASLRRWGAAILFLLGGICLGVGLTLLLV